MNTVSGVITGVYNKDVRTKFGPKQTWDVKLDNGEYYKNGFKKPSVEVGDLVDITFEDNQYGHQIKNLAGGLVGKGTPTQDTPQKALGSPYSNQKGNKVFPVPIDHGDRSIIRQNSLTNARELITTMLTIDGGVDGIDDVYNLADLCIKIAYKFEEYSSGDREVKAVDAMVNKTKTAKPAKSKPKAEVEEDTDAE